jgi:hypothetical protein
MRLMRTIMRLMRTIMRLMRTIMRLMRTAFAWILGLTIVSDMTRARPNQLCL